MKTPIPLQDGSPFPTSVGELEALCRRLGTVVDEGRAPVGMAFEEAQALWVSMDAAVWENGKEMAYLALLRAGWEWISRFVARNEGRVYFGGDYPRLGVHPEPNTGVIIAVLRVSILVTGLPLQPEDPAQRRTVGQLHGVTGNA